MSLKKLLSVYVITETGHLGTRDGLHIIKGVMEHPVDSEQLFFWTGKKE